MRSYEIGFSYGEKEYTVVVPLEMITEDNIIKELLKKNPDMSDDFDREKLVINSVVVA